MRIALVSDSTERIASLEEPRKNLCSTICRRTLRRAMSSRDAWRDHGGVHALSPDTNRGGEASGFRQSPRPMQYRGGTGTEMTHPLPVERHANPFHAKLFSASAWGRVLVLGWDATRVTPNPRLGLWSARRVQTTLSFLTSTPSSLPAPSHTPDHPTQPPAEFSRTPR